MQQQAEHRSEAPYVGDNKRDHSIPQLLRHLSHEVTELFSKEVALARAEAREAVHDVKAGIAGTASGAIVLLAGLIVLLMAGVYALATTLALWLSALIVGGGVTLVGLIMFLAGRSKLTAKSLKPQRTAHAVKQDQKTVKGVMQ